MTQTYIYAGIALVIGFGIAWIIQMINISKIKKQNKSLQGFWESEKLMKETVQKENAQVHQMKQVVELEMQKKLQEVIQLNKRMDADILLLQKSNEETEAQLASAQPELHAIKLKLIEANNTIARYKAQLGIK